MRSVKFSVFTTLLFAAIGFAFVWAPPSLASKYGKIHKVVIQVSTDDAQTQTIALNNALNLQNLYGIENVVVEIVAYGPGLGLLTKASPNSTRVESLAAQDIKFSACGNTIQKVTKKKGKAPALTEGVKVVPAGVGRIIELQEQGYSYVRP